MRDTVVFILYKGNSYHALEKCEGVNVQRCKKYFNVLIKVYNKIEILSSCNRYTKHLIIIKINEKMAFTNSKASASANYSSSDEESNEIYEDQYAEQIGKSVKCSQFINNVKATTTKGQGQKMKQVQGQTKQGQGQKMKQGQGQAKQGQAKQPVKAQEKKIEAQAQETPVQIKNTAREAVDDWEDLL
jgi:hypothetical protein